jgi:Fe-S cluster biogenesis protein NfuA
MGTTVESQATSETIESRVKDVIELIRPAIQADGGDIRLERVEGGTVTVQLLGVCESCPISPVTLKQGVERILRERIPGITEVIALEA